MIFTLIKNEIIKILSRGKTWVVFVMFIALIGLLSYGLNREANYMKKIDSPKQMVKNSESQIAYYKDQIKSMEDSLKTKDDPELKIKKESMERNKEDMENSTKEAKKLIAEGKGDEPFPLDLDKEIKDIESRLKNADIPDEHKVRDENQLKLYKYLKENGITPEKPYVLNGYNHIMTVISILGLIFLTIGLSIFGSDMVSGECTPPTLKFLLVQPISRGKVLFSKFISLVIVCIAMILSVEILSFIVMGVIKGFGNSNYPVIYGTQYAFDLTRVVDGSHPINMVKGSGEIITIAAFLLKALAYQTLFIVTVCSVVFLMSTIFKSSMISMAVSTSFFIIYSVLVNAISSLKKISHFIFITYGQAPSVLSGDLAMMYKNPSITIRNGIIVMVITILVSYTIAHINFKRKDILI